MRKYNHREGFSRMGLSLADIEAIDKGLHKTELPQEVLDTLIENEKRVRKIPLDKYPWAVTDPDHITYGLFDQGIDSRAVWTNAERYVKTKFNRGMPAQCDVKSGFEQALSNLFEMYALAKNLCLPNPAA